MRGARQTAGAKMGKRDAIQVDRINGTGSFFQGRYF
jgi:hypothetical protein